MEKKVTKSEENIPNSDESGKRHNMYDGLVSAAFMMLIFRGFLSGVVLRLFSIYTIAVNVFPSSLALLDRLVACPL